jgi:hypothetical protein
LTPKWGAHRAAAELRRVLRHAPDVVSVGSDREGDVEVVTLVVKGDTRQHPGTWMGHPIRCTRAKP